jgi:translocation and assembly module TamA
MKTPCAFILAALLVVGGCLGVVVPSRAEDVSEPVKYKVELDAPPALTNVLEASLDLVRSQTYDTMTPELLDRLERDAVVEAREALATEGYFSPEVRVESNRSTKPWIVRVTVVPGAPTLVSSLEIHFTGPIAHGDEIDQRHMERIHAEWLLPPGQPFRQQAWNDAKARVLEALSDVRYAAGRLAESEARVDPQSQTASLYIVLDSGPVFRIGRTEVTGLSRYARTRVENLDPLQPGEEYSRSRLDQFQRRLAATGYFASVQIRIDQDRSNADAAPIRVAVIEAPAKRVEVGVGYSTDTLYRLTLGYRDSNFRGDGSRLRADTRLESRAQSASLALDLPESPKGWGDTLATQVRRSDIQNLETEEFLVGARRRWLDERRQPEIGVSWRLEHQEPAGAPADDVFATYADYWFTRRTTDDLIAPRTGYVTQIQVGAAPPGLSTRGFGRLIGKFVQFVPVARDNDVVVRAEAGMVIAPTANGIPQSLLFRTGGDTTVRGYAFESLGVRKGDAVVGGRYYALASAEYTRWVTKAWGGAVFVDAGNALDDLSQARLAVGFGAGVRYRSPIGPFRIDVAYGRDDGELRVHFSGGLTF